MIRKVGSKWVLYSKTTGKRLGTHPTRAAAVRQEQAIHVHGGEDSGDDATRKVSRKGTPPEQGDLPGSAMRHFMRRADNKKTAKRGSNLPSASPSVPQIDEGSLEYFAATFLSSVQNGEMHMWDEYAGDPRVGQIASAVRKLGLTSIQRILGGGSFGVAAEDEAGHVLKLTSDRTEVQAGAVLKGAELPHVVWIAGSWLVRGVRVQPQWSEGLDLQVGILSMEMVGTDHHIPDDLNHIVHRVKRTEGAYPDDLIKMKPGTARLFLRHVSVVMEEEIRSAELGQIGDDVADGLVELRQRGVYAIDVHRGNVGYDERDNVYKLFDIGTSSSPAVPKPKIVAPAKVKRIAFEPYACESGLVVTEI
jgi:hypothetical protein